MPRESLAKTTAKQISAISRDLARLRELDTNQVIAVCAVHAQLTVATALLDVADAIHSNGTEAEQAVDRLTDAVRASTNRNLSIRRQM